MGDRGWGMGMGDRGWGIRGGGGGNQVADTAADPLHVYV